MNCDNCGAAVDTIENSGYEFVQSDGGRHLCFNCEWDEKGGAVFCEGGKSEEKYLERFDLPKE